MRTLVLCSANDAYAFQCYNMLASMKANSPQLFTESDILLLTDDMSPTNKKALLSLGGPLAFGDIEHDFPAPLLDHKHITTYHWGIFILQKFLAFRLLENYDRILWLDSDIFIYNELADLWQFEQHMAFVRNTNSYHKKLQQSLGVERDIPVPNAGLILFHRALRGLPCEQALEKAARLCSTFTFGAIDEMCLACIVDLLHLSVALLPRDYNHHTQMAIDFATLKILHFHLEKPWLTPSLYQALPEWGRYHRNFLTAGGTAPGIAEGPAFDRNSYFQFQLNAPLFIDLIKELDILHLPEIAFNYDFTKPFLQFHWRHFPTFLHYEIRRTEKERFIVALHYERKEAPENVVHVFEKIKDTIGLFYDVRFKKGAILGVEVTVKKCEVNSVCNVLHTVTQRIFRSAARMTG